MPSCFIVRVLHENVGLPAIFRALLHWRVTRVEGLSFLDERHKKAFSLHIRNESANGGNNLILWNFT
jgi:hypothetical protein